jgi:thymidylate synthase ThyX
MKQQYPFSAFAPLHKKDEYTDEEKNRLAPFFSNLTESVYVPLVLSPELIGALCSRTSRAAEDLRHIYINEYITPFLQPIREKTDTDESWNEKQMYSRALHELIEFLHKHPLMEIFSNPRARTFYIKWLAQFGDDSIAQMAGTHMVFSGLSQVAIKHLEDQRIGLAPIEKSTRYVDYSQKIDGHYMYYTDPTLAEYGLLKEYETVMNGLFDTYTALLPKMNAYLAQEYTEEKHGVIEKKSFDTLRGLLPVSTLSQVAFFGNGQSFEYMINRSATHSLGELRWVAREAHKELNKVTPSFMRRIDPEKNPNITEYQEYLVKKNVRMAPFASSLSGNDAKDSHKKSSPSVQLVEYDSYGQEKIITGMLYGAPTNRLTWEDIFTHVKKMSIGEKRGIIMAYLGGRNARWQKVGRAFENAYVRFDICMNIGAWRDLHRHRMLTQQRQYFTTIHGYDIPEEITSAGLAAEFCSALDAVEQVYTKIFKHDQECAQYCVALAHRVRFMQYENLRECFWEMELRTIPEGHPDYRKIEQEKFKLLEKVYPLITEKMLVNVGEYIFARRGQEDKIQAKINKMG